MNQQPTLSPAARRKEQPVIQPYDPETRRDWVRAAVTLTLLATHLGVLGIAFYSAHGEYEKTKELLDKVFTALVGLIGSALGFYFGSKNRLTTVAR